MAPSPLRTASAAAQGFTLLELMIVVTVIGIPAAIAIPNPIVMQDRAKEGSTKSNMHTVQIAAEGKVAPLTLVLTSGQ